MVPRKNYKDVSHLKTMPLCGWLNKENQGPFELRRRQIGYYDVFLLFGENIKDTLKLKQTFTQFYTRNCVQYAATTA